MLENLGQGKVIRGQGKKEGKGGYFGRVRLDKGGYEIAKVCYDRAEEVMRRARGSFVKGVVER